MCCNILNTFAIEGAEEANMAELKLKKQSLLEELREQMETARAVSDHSHETVHPVSYCLPTNLR